MITRPVLTNARGLLNERGPLLSAGLVAPDSTNQNVRSMHPIIATLISMATATQYPHLPSQVHLLHNNTPATALIRPPCSQIEDKAEGEPGFVLAEPDFVSSLLQLTFFPSGLPPQSYFRMSLVLIHLSPLSLPPLPLLYPAVPHSQPPPPHAGPGTCTRGCYWASSGPLAENRR